MWQEGADQLRLESGWVTCCWIALLKFILIVEWIVLLSAENRPCFTMLQRKYCVAQGELITV